MQVLFDIIYLQGYNIRKPIQSVRENGSLTTQQPAKQGANAEDYGNIIKILLPAVSAGSLFYVQKNQAKR